jgi:thiamine-monophosphate kinase
MNIGEFELIAQIRKKTRTNARVLLGIGDDAAVIRIGRRKDLLFTTDMLIENRHFRLQDATAYEIGRKALAVNLSDIAAMGGVPTEAVAALGLPKRLSAGFVDQLYSGIRDLAKHFHVNLAGGDTNISECLVISVALIGEVEKGKALRRSGARVGDCVMVSGALGGSYDSGKHLNFMPRVREARYLTKNFHVHAMMDISDGLASDAKRLAEESGVGILIEENRLPVSRTAKTVVRALTDGEDFELLFTLSEKEARRAAKRFHIIGRVVARGRGVKLLMKDGSCVPLQGGFDHFK